MMIDALYYATEMKWRIFPLRVKDKRPMTRNGVHDATTDLQQIKEWWTKWPDCNIGLACGKDSGVSVIDVDVDEEKNVNGWKSLKEFPAMPETIMQITPRGGRHYIYKTDNPPANKNNFRNGIDIRGDGYYIVLAPSIHPNGKAYGFAPHYAPGDIKPAIFPDFMRPENDNKKHDNSRPALPWERKQKQVTNLTAHATKKVTAEKSQNDVGSTDVMERAALYLDEIPPAVEGHGGHDSLLWAARSLVWGFNLSKSDALHLLTNYYNPRCVPPWDMSSPSARKDFERKLDEAQKAFGKARGWLLKNDDYSELNESELAAGREMVAALISNHLKKKLAKREPKTEKIPEIISRTKKAPDSYPDWVLHPTGALGEFVEWVNRSAGCYQPALALATAYTAWGTMMGRKIADEDNGRTNVYMMAVAHSSAGKDHPVDCCKKAFSAAGYERIINGQVTSDAAIEKRLEEFPVMLLALNEVGCFLHTIKSGGKGAGYQQTVIPTLMQLYSAAGSMYIGKEKASEAARRIEQPHVCVIGESSPERFFSSISSDELRDGWLGRNITVISKARPKYEFVEKLPVPAIVTETIDKWMTRPTTIPDDIGNIKALQSCKPTCVPMTAGARDMMLQCRDEFYGEMMKCADCGDDAQYLFGKSLQNVRRLALILAGNDNFDNPIIERHHFEMAAMFIRVAVHQFRESIAHNVADTEAERDKQYILNYIRKAGVVGLSKRELTRRTQRFRDKRLRDAYVEDLMDAGLIEHFINPLHEKSRGGYYWLAPFGSQFLERYNNKAK